MHPYADRVAFKVELVTAEPRNVTRHQRKASPVRSLASGIWSFPRLSANVFANNPGSERGVGGEDKGGQGDRAVQGVNGVLLAGPSP